MQLHTHGGLNQPGMCFLCETAPVVGEVVDTLREYDPGVVTILNGRKYVCEPCVAEMAALCGYEKSSSVKEAGQTLQSQRVAIDKLIARTADLGSFARAQLAATPDAPARSGMKRRV